MRFVGCIQVKRVSNVFHIEDARIPADRRSSDGYGVLTVFEGPTKLDFDFKKAVAERFGSNCLCWYPSARELKLIMEELDLSDKLTADWLRDGKGWTDGPRPYPSVKVEDFI